MPNAMFAATPPRRTSRSSARNDRDTLSSCSTTRLSRNLPLKVIRWSVAMEPVMAICTGENLPAGCRCSAGSTSGAIAAGCSKRHSQRMTTPEIEAFDFTGLRATFVNCTLKRSPEPSNTEALVDISAAIMRKHGVEVEVIRAVDHDLATGVYVDMTEHGWDRDEWPTLFA